jgi:hypothetical protein
MRVEREVHELINEFGIVLVPRLEELELPTREVGLDGASLIKFGRAPTIEAILMYKP